MFVCDHSPGVTSMLFQLLYFALSGSGVGVVLCDGSFCATSSRCVDAVVPPVLESVESVDFDVMLEEARMAFPRGAAKHWPTRNASLQLHSYHVALFGVGGDYFSEQAAITLNIVAASYFSNRMRFVRVVSKAGQLHIPTVRMDHTYPSASGQTFPAILLYRDGIALTKLPAAVRRSVIALTRFVFQRTRIAPAAMLPEVAPPPLADWSGGQAGPDPLLVLAVAFCVLRASGVLITYA